MSKQGNFISVASDQEGADVRIVTETNPLPLGLFDGYGNPIGSLKGALNIHDADVHNSIVNKYIHQHTATVTTLAANSAIDTDTLSLASGAGLAALDYIHINTTSLETTHPRILSSVPAFPTSAPVVVTLDRRLDVAHFTGDEVTKVLLDMSILVGTLAAPQIYYAGPPPGEVWHITRILFSMTHGTSGDLGLFGNLAALTGGCVLRGRVNGGYATLTNWKTNSDIKSDMYDVDFDSRSSGGGTYGTSGRGTFTNAGAVIRLDGDTSDRIELYVQDDITALNIFTIKAQGHQEAV
jgi:hypothetical protein